MEQATLQSLAFDSDLLVFWTVYIMVDMFYFSFLFECPVVYSLCTWVIPFLFLMKLFLTDKKNLYVSADTDVNLLNVKRRSNRDVGLSGDGRDCFEAQNDPPFPLQKKKKNLKHLLSLCCCDLHFCL